MNIVVLIDYDNLHDAQKISGVLDVVTKVLMQQPKHDLPLHGVCEIRIYGGWYEGELMSKLAQDVSVEIQDTFPSIIRVPATNGEKVNYAANAEIALALMEEPAHHLLNTYRKKGKPRNVRVKRPSEIGCTDSECILPKVRKILKTGSCSKTGCSVAGEEVVYRHEQKIVDTMLTCDLLYLSSQRYDHIILVSGDDDFLPPLRTLLLRGSVVTRVHPKTNNQRLPVSVSDSILVELEL